MRATVSGRGVRFAPSPTGTFHIGNLRTAWVSWKIAHALGEPWVVRVEDIDAVRARTDAWKSQLFDLSEMGLSIDILRVQSEYYARHLDAFERAKSEGKVYPCDCSRREVLAQLAAVASAPHSEEIEYSGHCRNRSGPISQFHAKETLAWRWRNHADSGARDSIIARSSPDGSGFSPGYHWACAIDDGTEKFPVLVRAWDLAAADQIQREIRNWIGPSTSGGLAEPVVFHTSLVTQNDGHRLEKRTQGVTLKDLRARGVSIDRLLDSFSSGFDLSAAIQKIRDGLRPAGEVDRSITLSALSL